MCFLLANYEETIPTHPLALTDIIKVSWCESLWQMAGEDEASKEGKSSVLIMDWDSSLCAALCHAQVELQQQRGIHTWGPCKGRRTTC